MSASRDHIVGLLIRNRIESCVCLEVGMMHKRTVDGVLLAKKEYARVFDQCLSKIYLW